MILPGTTLKALVKLPKDPAACWLWQGATNGDGRPVKTQHRVKPDGTSTSTNVSAQRWLWETLFGVLPKAFLVSTSCGESLCMNPFHFRALTHAEVQQERTGLTPADIAEAKRLAIQGGVPLDLLAPRYDIAPSTLCHIVKGRRWKTPPTREQVA